MNKNLKDHPHRRYNILTGEWVLVSPHRTKRPWQGKKDVKQIASGKAHDPDCYLCPGNTRAGGEKNPEYQSTYSFVNDFSALLPETPEFSGDESLLQARSERGLCKVICFSPDHSLTLPLMDVGSITAVVRLWKSEYQELGALPYIDHVQIFENKGAVMGCSNPHPHGQIWAQESIPQEVMKKQVKQREYWQKHGKSLLLDYLEEELRLQERIVLENAHFVALTPFWAVWPYEVMVVPKRHFQHIGMMNVDEETAFADMLKRLTTRYDNLFQTSFPYSSGIHQAPTDGEEHPEWHFHMSFYPPLLRSAEVKKFMVGYEMFANPQRDITAESAAGMLRSLPEVHYLKG